jgi:hypothetical protein
VRLPEAIGKRSEGLEPTGAVEPGGAEWKEVGIGQWEPSNEAVLAVRTTAKEIREKGPERETPITPIISPEQAETPIASSESAETEKAALTATTTVESNRTKPNSIPREPEIVVPADAQVSAPTITKTIESRKKNKPRVTAEEAAVVEAETSPIPTGPRARNPSPNASEYASESYTDQEDLDEDTILKTPPLTTRTPPPPHRKGSPKTIVIETTDQAGEKATSSLPPPSRKENTKTLVSEVADEMEEEAAEPASTTRVPPPPPRKENTKTIVTEVAEEEEESEAPRPTQATITEQETVMITVSPSRHTPKPKAQTKTAYIENPAFSFSDDEYEEEELPQPPRKHSRPKNKPESDFMTGDDVVWSTETFIEEIIGPSVTKTSVLELVVVQHTSTSMAEATGKAKEKEKEHRMQTGDGWRNGVAWWTAILGMGEMFAVAVIAAL